MVGPTDSGKTTLLREGHETFDGVSVWCNHRGGPNTEYTRDVAGYRAQGRQAMNTGVSRYDEWTDVRINLRIDDPERCVRTAVAFARDVWDTVGVPVMLVCDEVQHLIPTDADPSENIGLWCYGEGREHGIKFVGATQSPGKVNYKSDMGDARYWAFVGEQAKSSAGFRQYYGVPDEAMPSERFRYAVLSRSMQVLYEGTTDPAYG